MSLMPHFPDGYYDDNGEWQRSKFCFVSCGAACTCMPPFGAFYSAAHDKRLGGTPIGSTSNTEGGADARAESKHPIRYTCPWRQLTRLRKALEKL